MNNKHEIALTNGHALVNIYVKPTMYRIVHLCVTRIIQTVSDNHKKLMYK